MTTIHALVIIIALMFCAITLFFYTVRHKILSRVAPSAIVFKMCDLNKNVHTVYSTTGHLVYDVVILLGSSSMKNQLCLSQIQYNNLIQVRVRVSCPPPTITGCF